MSNCPPKSCTACKFGKGNAIAGVGPASAKLMVVTDRVYKGDEQAGQPCRDTKHGFLLRQAVKNLLGLDPETEVYWTSVLKCNPSVPSTHRRSKKGEEPVVKSVAERKADAEKKKQAQDWSKEIKTCRTWLDQELERVEAPVILLAGESAIKSLAPTLSHPWISHGQAVWDPIWMRWFVACFAPKDVNDFSSYDDQGTRQILTGSLPWLFMQDLLRLKELLQKEN